MRRNYEQMTLGNIYSDIAYCFEEEKPRFFRLMEQYIDWDAIIPLSFYNALQENGTRAFLLIGKLYLYAGIAKGLSLH